MDTRDWRTGRWRALGRIGIVGAVLLALPLALVGRAAPVAASGWLSGGTLPAAFESPRAALLPDGRVVVADGAGAAVRANEGDTWTASVFAGVDPATVRLGGAELIALADGTALLAGGSPYTFLNNPFAPTTQVFRLDPVANVWTAEGGMPTGRSAHTLTNLADGRVLAVGGSVGSLSPRAPTTTIGKVELYDPARKTWTATGALAQPRYAHTATRLPDGRILVVGGLVSKTVNSENAGSDRLASVEIYDPSTGLWRAAASLGKARAGHVATALLDGTVLVVGGDGGEVTSAERYNPLTDTWSPSRAQGTLGSYDAATLLPNGDVMLTGTSRQSSSYTAPLVTRYYPTGDQSSSAAVMETAHAGHAAVLVNGQVLVIGGQGDTASRSTERYDVTPAGGACFAQTGHCMADQFQAYWQAHGGLVVSGYPLSEPFAERLEDGKVYRVQYFERVRMEYHPEQPDPQFQVLLGQFGRRIHPADPAVAAKPGARFFAETGHNLHRRFRRLLGCEGRAGAVRLPADRGADETLEDGATYRVQYFERARLECHPEQAARRRAARPVRAAGVGRAVAPPAPPPRRGARARV